MLNGGFNFGGGGFGGFPSMGGSQQMQPLQGQMQPLGQMWNQQPQQQPQLPGFGQFPTNGGTMMPGGGTTGAPLQGQPQGQMGPPQGSPQGQMQGLPTFQRPMGGGFFPQQSQMQAWQQQRPQFGPGQFDPQAMQAWRQQRPQMGFRGAY